MAEEEYRHPSDHHQVACSPTAIGSANIGFKLLRKHGWKEGTGLGASEQGRLEPVETYIKQNKKGLGAEKVKSENAQLSKSDDSRKCIKSDYHQADSSSTAIGSSNIGFQLLKKHGWKEGTGLGVSEQGRLEPVATYLKNNKKGLGAEKLKSHTSQLFKCNDSRKHRQEVAAPLSKKEKAISKRLRKIKEKEQNIQEKEFEISFFREFWPDNV